MESPLVNNNYLLKKFPGKGGWTYATIPEVLQDKKTPFGWVKVKGTIDGFELKNYRLMPMGNGKLFLPVKAEIRRIIGKKEGDSVKVILYPDYAPPEIRDELLLCLRDDPAAYQSFANSSKEEQNECIEWIYSAKTDPIKVERMANVVNKLAKEKKLK
jgi:hypothetical protein